MIKDFLQLLVVLTPLWVFIICIQCINNWCIPDSFNKYDVKKVIETYNNNHKQFIIDIKD